MEIAKIRVSGTRAYVLVQRRIPAGLVGGYITVEYAGPEWDGLSTTAVFRGAVTRDVLDAGETIVIPHETVAVAGKELQVGFYGTNSDGTIVIPTLWACFGVVAPAADPSGDISTDPSLPVWAQIQADVEKLKRNGEGSIDPDAIKEAVEGYLEENPPAQFKTDGETLTLEDGTLSVMTVNEVLEHDPHPVTSGAVYDEFSKAVALLKTI